MYERRFNFCITGQLFTFVLQPIRIMRESSFIKHNKDKWKEFEYASTEGFDDPEKLSDLYVQVTDDLSYSRTFYPNRSVRVYLNTLAQRIFSSIFKYKKNRRGQFVFFWKEALPRLVYESRKEMLLALLVMIFSVIIGAFSQANDPDFIRTVVGDGYVEMTKENIASGDPMAVYKEAGAFSMFLGITLNNIWVSFLTFIMGIFFGIGTLGMLIRTGIMIGAFHGFFLSKGFLAESLLAVWLHGTLEISAITLAGAAGLTMGRGLLFPGTYSRLQAFQMGARRGISIMLGITPVLVLAGFIEGFLTRYTDAPMVLRLLIILLSLAFIVGYYVVYPILKARRGFDRSSWQDAIPADYNVLIVFDQVKSGGNVFSDAFLMVKKHLSTYLWAAGIGSVIYCAVLLLIDNDHFYKFSYPQWPFSTVVLLGQFFNNEGIPVLPFLNIGIFCLLGTVVWYLFEKETGFVQGKPHLFTVVIVALKSILPILLTFATLFFLPVLLIYVVMILLLPLSLMWWYVQTKETFNPITSIGRTFFLLRKGWGEGIILYFLLILISLLSLGIMDWAVGTMIVHSIGIGLGAGSEQQIYFLILMTFLTYAFILLILLLVLTAAVLLYYSQLEINEAAGLKQRILQVAAGKRVQGMVRE